MITKEIRRTAALRVPDDLEVVEYPPEVVERWDKEFEIAKLQLATGELVPQTVEELAAELGIDLGDADYDDDEKINYFGNTFFLPGGASLRDALTATSKPTRF